MAGEEVEAEIRIPQPRRQKLLICCVKNTGTASSQCTDCSCEAHTQKDKVIKRILQFFATPVFSLSISSALGQLPYYKKKRHSWPAPLATCGSVMQEEQLLSVSARVACSSLSKVRSFCKNMNEFLQKDKNAGEEK